MFQVYLGLDPIKYIRNHDLFKLDMNIDVIRTGTIT